MSDEIKPTTPLEKLTPRKALNLMKKLEDKYNGDVERNHYEADELLCRIAEEAGFASAVKQFKRMHKWYA